jgi:nucleotide-binding universal stress UspA family protein
MNAPGLSPRPIIFCYDGSPGSRNAMRHAGQSLRPAPALVVTAWQTIVARLQTTPGLAGAPMIFDSAEADDQEQQAAEQAAADGARRAAEHGFDSSHLTVQANGPLWQALVAVAEKNDAALIVCGAKGHSRIRELTFGSTSAGLLHHARCPVLIAPEINEEVASRTYRAGTADRPRLTVTG